LAEPSRAWWTTSSDERRKYFREHYREFNATPANRAKKNARQKAYYYRHRERMLAGQRFINYNCTEAQYAAMLDGQQHKCAICGGEETATRNGRVKQLSVDHDHETGRIRALLCGGCNAGLGAFRSNPAVLEAAIAYPQFRWCRRGRKRGSRLDPRANLTTLTNSFTTHWGRHVILDA